MNFNLIDLLHKARIVAWPLGLCSILALAIILARRSLFDAPAPTLRSSGPRWELHLGGAAGLLIGLVIRLGDLPAGSSASFVPIGMATAFRGLVWFATFAIVEAWLDRSRGRWTRALPLLLMVTVFARLPSTVRTTSTSPRPARLVGMRILA